jgi:hypothetical protein
MRSGSSRGMTSRVRSGMNFYSIDSLGCSCNPIHYNGYQTFFRRRAPGSAPPTTDPLGTLGYLQPAVLDGHPKQDRRSTMSSAVGVSRKMVLHYCWEVVTNEIQLHLLNDDLFSAHFLLRKMQEDEWGKWLHAILHQAGESLRQT